MSFRNATIDTSSDVLLSDSGKQSRGFARVRAGSLYFLSVSPRLAALVKIQTTFLRVTPYRSLEFESKIEYVARLSVFNPATCTQCTCFLHFSNALAACVASVENAKRDAKVVPTRTAVSVSLAVLALRCRVSSTVQLSRGNTVMQGSILRRCFSTSLGLFREELIAPTQMRCPISVRDNDKRCHYS